MIATDKIGQKKYCIDCKSDNLEVEQDTVFCPSLQKRGCILRMIKMTKIRRAIEFARRAHEGQLRWNEDDYFESHVVPVAESICLKGLVDRDQMEMVIISGYLHDTIEDTTVTFEEITQEFGDEIGVIIDLLTHSRDETYAEYIMRLYECRNTSLGNIAIRVKLADLENNMSTGIKPKKHHLQKYQLAKAILQKGLDVV
jgi:(p)ppGpp synthase/HD superfamily hydrolase